MISSENYPDKPEFLEMSDMYKNCTLCPRRCGVDRLSTFGFCGESDKLRLACASIHRGEEPPVTGLGGSGTIFVSGCNLGCVFCQNYQISRSTVPSLGRAVDITEFAGICLALEKQGAENINIVTGSHAIPAIAAGIDAAKAAGLNIPVLWNSSSYESVESLELLRGRINRFLPDLKTLDPGLAARFFRAPAYPLAAATAIQKMIELCDSPANGYDRVIIRHLILPGFLESTRQVLAWFAEHARGKALLSLMTQYTPPKKNIPCEKQPPARYVNKAEYETVLGWLEEFGIEDGFCQELVTGSGWLPDFNRTNPFSSGLSKPVWHWSEPPFKP
jgi:putative pyruvate formate lyase activating enzyme